MENKKSLYVIIVAFILIIPAIFIWNNYQVQEKFDKPIRFNPLIHGEGSVDYEEPILSSIEAKAIVGSEGGVVEVDNPSSKIFGFKIEIPKGALDDYVEIVVSISDIKEVKYQDVINVGEVIKLEPKGIVFNSPVLITIPYQGTNFIEIMDRNNISEEDIFISLFVGRWLRKAPYNLDISKKQISFYIYHLTDFAATVIVRNHLEQ